MKQRMSKKGILRRIGKTNDPKRKEELVVAVLAVAVVEWVGFVVVFVVGVLLVVVIVGFVVSPLPPVRNNCWEIEGRVDKTMQRRKEWKSLG